MNQEPLPFPYDHFHLMREANVSQARKIYHFALRQAEITAEKHGSASGPSAWPLPLDIGLVSVQPLQPTATFLSPRELQQRVRVLREGPGRHLFSDLSKPIPDGVLYPNFYLPSNRRHAQMTFTNGHVCGISELKHSWQHQTSLFQLAQLLQNISHALQSAYYLQVAANEQRDMALLVSVENLGEHIVESPLSNGQVHDYGIPLIENWIWNYSISKETFHNLPSLGSFTVSVLEDVCWGIGDSRVDRQVASMLAKAWGTVLSKEIPL